MGDIADQGSAWQRDYVTDGVSASGINDPAKGDGRTLFGLIDGLLYGIRKLHAGTSAPSAPAYGTPWMDTTNNILKLYDGAAWIALFSIDPTGHVATLAVAIAAPGYAGVRQTVAAGPVTTDGLPSFLPGTHGALSVTSQNVSSSAPLVAAAANGWSAATGQPVDAVGTSSANLTWSGLTASRAAATPNFLYGTIFGGVITPASTLLAPVYQWGGTPSTTSGQITFNIAEMKAYLGTGSAAPQTDLVVFGEAATDGSGVISTVAYAYNGRYESAFTATLPAASTLTSANHNIGVPPRIKDFIAECTSTENGYSVGDQISACGGLGTATTIWYGAPVKVTAKTIGVATSTGNGGNGFFAVNGAGSGAQAGLTAASWKYKFVAARGW